ncbi:hypothetical protein HO133_003588 [Letharia lupina]|uniref:HOOK N-terminal domain-containing protein n=1 Tax=Letharia lupina TaxID=560253 RepID=A0A8H6CA49_9LECA|nr:uncharacterized protein HO133_003588 [Letharia lupina]KAF6219763.1 hypothetical protein HO133_003588 [Letharia lupina]
MATNGTLPHGTEAALVVWVNSFPLTNHVNSLSEMNDGQALWEMLREIHAEAFTGELPSKKQSAYARQQNLQHVYRKIASHLDEHDATFTIFTDDELRDMAVDESSTSIAKFLQLVLQVVITPPNEAIFQKLRILPDPTPQVILRLWQETMDQAEDEEVDENSDMGSGRRSSNSGSNLSSARVIDRELRLEQHLAELKSQLDRCEAEVKDLKEAKEQTDDAYNRLSESYDAIRKENTEIDKQLKKFTATHNEREQRSVKELETKISQQEEVIGRQETQINESRSKEAEMQRKIKKLDAADDRLQNLQDDFDVQKVELEHQTRKANAGEKYKQKVQASQNLEKERDSLRKELNEARSRLEEAGDLRRGNVKLQQENREISQTLSRSERDNTELRETKQAYLGEINRLHHDSKSLRDALAQSQDRITDLEERFGGPERHSSVDHTLDSELAEALNHEQQMQVASTVLLWTRVLMSSRKIRITELEKLVRQLKSDASDRDTKLAMLQGQLDSAREDSADQYKQGFEVRQEMSVLQSSLTEVRQGHSIEGTETFKRMREQIKAQQKQCAHLEEKLSAAQKVLEAAESDRELMDKPKLQVIEEVRMQNSLAMTQLQSEHDALRNRHNRLHDMFVDLTEERNAAWHDSHEAVMAKAESDMKADADSQTLQESTDLLRQAGTLGSIDESKGIKIYASKIEESRERLAKAQKHIEKQDALVKDLEARLEQTNASAQNNVEDANKLPATKVSHRVFITSFSIFSPLLVGGISHFTDHSTPSQNVPTSAERSYTQNLEREIKLIASAYHDLAGRLQMNNVILQRRTEAPKSWLGRQRKAMEGVGGLVR